MRSEFTLVRSRWEPCLGTGVPLLVALDAPQFRLDSAGNVMAVMPIGGNTVTPGDAALRLDPLPTATPPHGDSATPRKRCLAPRALLPSPDSVTDGLAPMLHMLAPPTMCDREGADTLSVVLKLAEAVRRRLAERHTRCTAQPWPATAQLTAWPAVLCIRPSLTPRPVVAAGRQSGGKPRGWRHLSPGRTHERRHPAGH